MKLNRTTLLISSAIGALMIQAPAFAADADPKSNVSTVEEIVVTAQKRAQTVIDIPQAISVISGDTLETHQANTFADYLKLVPGLQLVQSTPGQGRLVMRGVNTGGVASTVAVYMDETPFGSSSAPGQRRRPGRRLRHLRRGPDRGAARPARHAVRRQLDGRPAEVRDQHAQHRAATRPARASAVEQAKGGDMPYRTNGGGQHPAQRDGGLPRLGLLRKDGGFVDSIGTAGSDVADDINDAKVYGGRASLLFKPNDAFDLRLTAVAQNIKADAPTVVESDPNTLKTCTGDRPCRSSCRRSRTSTTASTTP
jgi:iron complex outermembrane receptor protein